MCGFAGFVGSVENREAVLEHMMDTIIHRARTVQGNLWMKMRRWDSGG